MAELVVTKEQLQEMMKQLDQDGNGVVTKDEFKAPYKKLFPKISDKEFDTTWKKIDADGSGTLELKELAKYYGFSLEDVKACGTGGDADMTDEQILEALQMQTALAELQAQAEAKREGSPSAQKAEPKKESRRGSSGTIEARKKNSSGVVTVKMPSKTTFEVSDPNVLFLQACELGDTKDIEKRIDEGANVRVEDDKGEMPLHKLARLGSIEMIRKVLEKVDNSTIKTDINWQDKNGKSAIFFAADFKKVDVVTLLLDRGADVKIENNNGWTVLHSAVNANDDKVVSAILLHPFIAGDSQVKKDLVNAKDRQGRTALHIAAFKAHENLVEFLLQHGADPTMVDSSGNNASKLAGKSGRRKSKDLLDAAA